MANLDFKRIGHIDEVKQTSNGILLDLSLENNKTQLNIQPNAERGLGFWQRQKGKLLCQNNQGQYFIQKIVKVLNPEDNIGIIVGSTTTNKFRVAISPAFEEFVPELSFIKTQFLGKDFFGQILFEWREQDNRVFGQVEILERKPKIPFRNHNTIHPASESEVQNLLSFDPSGYFIGKLLNSNIKVYLESKPGERNSLASGLTAVGKKSAGKSVGFRVFAEEKLDHGECVLVIDPLGDFIFNIPLQEDGNFKEKMDYFGISPKGYPMKYLSSDEQLNPFTTSEFGENVDVFRKKEFYDEFLKPGTATVISLKGLNPLLKDKLVANVAYALRDFGLEGRIDTPVLFGVDEAHTLAQQQGKSESKTALTFLVKEAGHINVQPYFMSQRTASVTKDIVAPQGAFVVHNLSDPNDLNNLGDTFKHYRTLIQRLTQGQGLLYGLSKSTVAVEFRPPKSQYFREAHKLVDFANKYPEFCKIDLKDQKLIDSL